MPVETIPQDSRPRSRQHEQLPTLFARPGRRQQTEAGDYAEAKEQGDPADAAMRTSRRRAAPCIDCWLCAVRVESCYIMSKSGDPEPRLHYARMTVTARPPGVVALSVVVRWLMSGCLLR